MIPAEGLFMFCGGEEQPVPGDATFNKEGEGQKLLAPAVRGHSDVASNRWRAKAGGRVVVAPTKLSDWTVLKINNTKFKNIIFF